MKNLYQEIEEIIIEEKNVIDLLKNQKFKENFGTEYEHVKNHFEENEIGEKDNEQRERPKKI
jgi:hypothetical protein